jgi:hypothetical protein
MGGTGGWGEVRGLGRVALAASKRAQIAHSRAPPPRFRSREIAGYRRPTRCCT